MSGEHLVIKKALEDPHRTMKVLAKQLEPTKLGGFDHKKLSNYVKTARFILTEKRGEFKEDAGKYEEQVSAAERHLEKRHADGGGVAQDMLVKLKAGGSLRPSQLNDIEEALPELESYFGIPHNRVEEIRAAIDGLVQAPRPAKPAPPVVDPVSRHVDSLLDTLSRPSLEKIRIIVPEFEELSRDSPDHPKLAELETAIQRAKLHLSKELLAEIGRDIPEGAKPHLTALAKSVEEIEAGDDEFIKASKSLVIAVNTENFALMQKKCIPPENYEASRKVLGKISSLHDLLMVQDKSHLARFLNLLEAAKGCIAK